MKPSRNCLIRALFMTQPSSILGSKWEEYVLSIQPRDVGRVEDRKKGSGRGKGRGGLEGGRESKAWHVNWTLSKHNSFEANTNGIFPECLLFICIFLPYLEGPVL